MVSTAADSLGSVPPGLRKDLLTAFNEIVTNFREHRWEPSELNGGKLCEAVYTIALGHLEGEYPERATKPQNMLAACRALEQWSDGPRSVRIQIPRIVCALYEIRNNRGVGHAGGDVNPNQMDATVVLYMAKWLVAELVRVLHDVSNDEAVQIVEGLIEREIPLVWNHGEIRRVLQPGLTKKEQVLVLLLPEHGGVTEAQLLSWMEVRNRAAFRRDVLRPMHRDRLIEFSELQGTARLLPPGVANAEALVS
jgi:hypothetical protein